METLGTRIGDYRKRKGIKQDQLAEYMGVSTQAVSKWENDLSCPDITLLPQLANFFNLTIDELLCGEKNKVVKIIPEEDRKDFNKLILRISINSAGGDIIKLNSPLGLVQTAMEIGMQWQFSENESLKNIDYKSILLAAQSGVVGKLLEIKSINGDNIEIIIE